MQNITHTLVECFVYAREIRQTADASSEVSAIDIVKRDYSYFLRAILTTNERRGFDPWMRECQGHLAAEDSWQF